MVHPNQEMEDLEVEIVEAEVDMEATEAVALEGVEVSAGVTVEASEEVAEDLEVAATKWEEEVTAGTTEETGRTECSKEENHSSP